MAARSALAKRKARQTVRQVVGMVSLRGRLGLSCVGVAMTGNDVRHEFRLVLQGEAAVF